MQANTSLESWKDWKALRKVSALGLNRQMVKGLMGHANGEDGIFFLKMESLGEARSKE